MTMVNHESSKAIVSVTCKCGRSLRAKSELAGTEVRCWDCHQMVLIPFPRPGKRVARALSEGALVVINGPGLSSVLAAAAVVTAVLTIPTYGVWCSVLVFMLCASAYGEIIRGYSRAATDVSGSVWYRSLVPKSILEAVACFLMAAGTVIPLWYLNSGLHQSPHWDKNGLAITVATWVVLPVVMMIFHWRTDQDTRLGVPKCLRLIAKHPFATLLALAIVPLVLALTEVFLGLIFYMPGNLPFLALDFMPMPSLPDKPIVYDGIPYYRMVDYRSYPGSIFINCYFDGLYHGYSFVGAIPASLSLPTRANLNPQAIWLDSPVYAIARGFVTMLVVTCLLTAFAIQARWLGAIPALKHRRPA